VIAPTIRTQRLILRPFRREDFALFVELYTTERSRHIGGPRNPDQVWSGFIDSAGHWSIMGFGGWAVDLAATGQCIGEVAISQPPVYPETELGWVLFEGFEGFGYATEAAQAAQEFAWSVVRPASLVSYIDPANPRSIAVAQRLGGTRDPAAPTPNNDPTLVYRYQPPQQEPR
jgi:RimJ/RimL family protein N-acetyltransferase